MKNTLPGLLFFVSVLTACNFPGLSGLPEPASSTPYIVAVTATPQPLSPATPTSTITPTPVPTISPHAITRQTAEQVQPELWLPGGNGLVYGVGVSSDGSLIGAGGTDRLVRIFDGRSGELLHVMEHHRHNIFSMAFSPDSRFLVSGSRDKTVQIWNPLTGERLTGARTAAQITQVALSPDGAHFAAVGLYSPIGEVWQTDTGAALFTLEGHHTRLRSVAYSRNGSWLATGDQKGEIVLHDPANGKPLFSLTSVNGEIYAIAFSPDDSLMAVGTSKGYVELWSLEERSFEGKWSIGSCVTGLTYSIDGSMILSSAKDGTVRFWDAVTNQRLGRLQGHGGSINSISLSLDGVTLASAGSDGLVIVWRVQP
ncbi:MAG: WD40 repeat domain-containing protein [Anaerolineae bacterium]|nr:WD40 repeat domain-containing protein [Anaerolineae bacterium]